MPKVNLIGSSNRQTNQTCVFGSMAGLAPTTNVRPNVTGLPGYKYARAAANGINWSDGTTFAQSVTDKKQGCGLNRTCDDGRKCVKHIGYTNLVMAYRTGAKVLA